MIQEILGHEMIKILNRSVLINFIFLVALLLTSCNSGTSTSSSQVYNTISVPTVKYASKFAIYTSVAGGTPTLTEIDTGSDFLVVESSFVGPNIFMTDESITLVYDHGTVQRSGVIGYGSVSLLSSTYTPLLTTDNLLPIVVVNDGVVGNQGNNAIMGLRMNSNLSLKSYLPYPYNQMFVFDEAESQLIFGNLTPQQLESYSTTSIPSISCENMGLTVTATNPCWNDMAIPVNYVIESDPAGIELYNSLFDSGAGSSIQFDPLPSFLNLGGFESGQVYNTITAVMYTTHGNVAVQLTNVVDAYPTNVNGGIVNVGNNIFNYNKVLFNQYNGTIGLIPNQ